MKNLTNIALAWETSILLFGSNAMPAIRFLLPERRPASLFQASGCF